MDSQRADTYWASVLGIEPYLLYQPGPIVLAHARSRKGHYAFILVRGDTIAIAVPASLVSSTRSRIKSSNIGDFLLKESCLKIFPEEISRTVGPLYQGYAEPEGFTPIKTPDVRTLSGKDKSARREFSAACDATEWEQSNVGGAKGDVFGYVIRGRIVALAHYSMWAEHAASMGAITHPAYRRKGLAKAVVSAAMDHAFTKGHFALYQTLDVNLPAVRLAQSLGFREYGHTMTVHFAEA